MVWGSFWFKINVKTRMLCFKFFKKRNFFINFEKEIVVTIFLKNVEKNSLFIGKNFKIDRKTSSEMLVEISGTKLGQ